MTQVPNSYVVRNTIEGMQHDIYEIPNVIRAIVKCTPDLMAPPQSNRLLVVAHGANLHAANIMARSLAMRGYGARFADPHNAIPVEGETLIGISRSAENDNIMSFLKEASSEDNPFAIKPRHILLTNQPDSPHINDSIVPVDLCLPESRPNVATQSVFAIVMLLDFLYTPVDERDALSAKWLTLAEKLEKDMERIHERARRQSAVLALSEGIQFLGSLTMEAVAHSLTYTILETTHIPCFTFPLSAGKHGARARTRKRDCTIYLGPSDEASPNTGYHITIDAPPHTQGLGRALYVLLHGQLLSMELRRNLGVR